VGQGRHAGKDREHLLVSEVLGVAAHDHRRRPGMRQWSAGCLFCGGNASEPNHAAHCDGRQGWIEANQPDDITGMVHADDPHTSIDAAIVIASRRNELHEKVLAAFAHYGAMTDEELENLPEFHDYGPSTIRKRRSELFQQHAIVAVGEAVNTRGRKMLIWSVLVERENDDATKNGMR
jgi:hypothetical protein